MPDHSAKHAVLRTLQREPDLSGLDEIPPLRSAPGVRLLSWLDHSGLALPFWQRVVFHDNNIDRLPIEWREPLQQRKDRNSARFRDMLQEFGHLNEAFRKNSLDCITLKGFSLIPDFCDDATIRHQTDFDFLVDLAEAEKVAAVLQSLGYSTSGLSLTDESCFTTPLREVPSSKDDIYALQQHRQVDIHASLVERSKWIDPHVPADCTHRAVDSNLCGVPFRAPSLADRFVCQVLHAFRHSFRSWVRLSWLMEIGRCVELHAENTKLWQNVIKLSSDDLVTRRIFGFMLSLTNRLFKSVTPPRLQEWTESSMTKSMRAWLDYFSERWALADWPGSLSNLFLASDFIQDANLRNRYLASRLVPKKAVAAVEKLQGATSRRTFGLGNAQQWIYVAHRSRLHAKDLLSLPADLLRWKFALRKTIRV